jgi:predicted nucleotidyltransferase
MNTSGTLNPDMRQVLAELRSDLERKVPLHSLVLFGSRARGDSAGDSDMDVLVVVDRLNWEIEQTIRDCTWRIGLSHGIVIVPVIYSRDEWENGPDRSSLLALAIEKEGVPA